MKFRDGISHQILAPVKTCKLCSAYHIFESFDSYTTTADAFVNVGNGGGWASSGSGWSLSTRTRWGTGQAMTTNSGTPNILMARDGSTNENTWFCCCAFMQTAVIGAHGGGASIGFQLRDGGTGQCSVFFNNDGSIKLYSGNLGTVLASWSPAFVANSYDHYQFKIIIHNTNGEFHIRKNGSASDSFSATGLNTRGGTANNYANGAAIYNGAAINNDSFMDDVMIFNGNGATTPNDWVGDCRAIQGPPTFDTAQLQFSRITSVSAAFGNTDNSQPAQTVTANIIRMFQTFTPVQGGYFSSATLEVSAGVTGNLKVAIYQGDGDVRSFNSNNVPGYLLAVSNPLVNPATGVNTITFPGNVPIENRQSYWIGFLSDVNVNIKMGGGFLNSFTYNLSSYAGGFPNFMGTIYTGTGPTDRSPCFYTTLTVNNAGCVNDFQEDGTSTYVLDDTVGHYDLYTLADLPYTPASIIGVLAKSFVQKSDAGARGFKISGLSNVTAFDTPEYAPLTAFSPFQVFYPTDPDTGSAWTAAAINALQLGPKVSS